jgi:Domain of unknown function (DUF4194)
MSELDQPTVAALNGHRFDESLDADAEVEPRSDWMVDEPDVGDPEREQTSSVALFEGDDGGLELDHRRALVVLLKNRFISARTHPREWRTLSANPRVIRTRLNDLFLDLHLDVEREVAYKRQVTPEGGGRPFPTLLHDTPWGREDTILLIYLRSRFRGEQASGVDRVFVDRDDMLEFVEQHRPEHATDQAGDARRAAKAIEALYRAGLLIGPSTADRFEVSNAVEVLLPLEKLQELLAWLRQQNRSPTPDKVDQASTDEHES